RFKIIKFLPLGLVFLSLIFSTVSKFTGTRKNKLETLKSESNPESGTEDKNLDGSWKNKNYTAVVVFGASYSDDAHPRKSIYRNSLRPKPYYEGRASNGPVFGEYLSHGYLTNYTISQLNYAYGGAIIENSLRSTSVPDLKSQVESHIKDIDTSPAIWSSQNTRVLHCVCIGINDFLSIWSDMVSKPGFRSGNSTRIQAEFEGAKAIIENKLERFTSEMQRLMKNKNSSSIAADYLVMLLPPLDLVPNLRYQAREKAPKNTTMAALYLDYVGRLSLEFNKGFRIQTTKLASLKSSKDYGSKIGFVKIFDTEALFRKAHNNPSQFDFLNVNEACWNSSSNLICQNPDHWAFWDTLHPTTAFHKIIARELMFSANDDKHQSKKAKSNLHTKTATLT
ncbi:hypothetical protein BY996DRAFT_8557085, partial [Phakopsora pachyrhizi]